MQSRPAANSYHNPLAVEPESEKDAGRKILPQNGSGKNNKGIFE
jgi:hypothetical protein